MVKEDVVCVCVCVCVYHFFFIHSSLDGRLGSLHTLAIVDSAAINIGVYMPFKSVFLCHLG